ncbi:methionine sulfoxide reductase A [Pseudorhodoferax sp. Leaf267]|nr:methionine sulfoxide reductase A [Pseudorhodoferax sp. Leaf267]
MGTAALAAFGGTAFWQLATASSEARTIPAFAGAAPTNPPATEVAVLAGGCFWGVQGVFQHVKGVSNAVSGYAGGEKATATYEQIGSGRTGHAEAVQVYFDPRQISYAQILQIYFSVVHDPTQLNRQGPDFGKQYRSTVFPQDEAQARIARDYIAQLNQSGVFKDKIATTIEPGRPFYAAEAYHQDYLVRNPRQPYIVINDQPKIEDLKKIFPAVYRAEPALVKDARKAG